MPPAFSKGGGQGFFTPPFSKGGLGGIYSATLQQKSQKTCQRTQKEHD